MLIRHKNISTYRPFLHVVHHYNSLLPQFKFLYKLLHIKRGVPNDTAEYKMSIDAKSKFRILT